MFTWNSPIPQIYKMTSKKLKQAEQAAQNADGNNESDTDSSSDEEMEDAAENEVKMIKIWI